MPDILVLSTKRATQTARVELKIISYLSPMLNLENQWKSRVFAFKFKFGKLSTRSAAEKLAKAQIFHFFMLFLSILMSHSRKNNLINEKQMDLTIIFFYRF